MQAELGLRVISAVVLVVLALASAVAGGIWFRVAAVAITLLVYYEWSAMARLSARDRLGSKAGWSVVALVALLILIDQLTAAAGLLLVLALAAAGELALLRRSDPWIAGGVLYASFAGISLAAIRESDSLGLAAIFFVFAVVWSTDTAAYFTGRAFGGPKLAPRISPGKTWSGAIGGMAAGIAAGLLVAYSGFGLSGFRLAVVAGLLSIASQLGDLFESFVKRRCGVKDSGRLIPGHGGVMDRVDGLVFACFAALVLGAVEALRHGRELRVADALFGF